MQTPRELASDKGIQVLREKEMVKIPFEQALQLYWLTEIKDTSNREDIINQAEACRVILRSITKRLLMPGRSSKSNHDIFKELVAQVQR